MVSSQGADLMVFTFDALFSQLIRQGWATEQCLLNEKALEQLRAECLQGWHAGSFHEAAVGRANARQRRANIRSDFIYWLDPAHAGAGVNDYFERLEALRLQLNYQLYLGLTEIEAHFAIYPKGARYACHLDRFCDDDTRVISSVLYLNPHWDKTMGGQLRLYQGEDRTTYHDIDPVAGTLVVFLSDQIWHEVLPTQQERLSVTAWFRRRVLS